MKLARTATKLIFCLLSAFFIIGIVPSITLTANASTEEDFSYTILTDDEGNKYVEITDYKGEDVEVRIPNEIEGYPVKSIGEKAFYHYSGYYGEGVIYMPDSITNIGDRAFEECRNLIEIVLSNNLETIGDYAFYRCEIESMPPLPDSVTSIGNYAFYDCFGFSELFIGNNVSRIEEGAFAYTSIRKLTIGDNVTYIGPDAFSGCYIDTLNLGHNITEISSTSFYCCERLTNITVDKNNQYYTSVDGVLYTKDMSALVLYPCNKSGTKFTIPNGVTKINDYAFKFCLNLENIDIPNSVQYIGTSAFSRCQKLTDITIPSSVISLGDYTFTEATGLKSVYIQNGLTSIDKYTFDHCSSLNNIFIPNSVTSIDKTAFKYSTKVTIYGFKDSYAEEYAKSYNIKFLEYMLSTPKITKTQVMGVKNIKLTWSKTVGASGYMVYRSTKQTGGWSRIATVDGESTLTYTDNNAVPGTQYYYTVKAYLNIGGTNTYSDYNKTGFAGKTTFTVPKVIRTHSNGYNRIIVDIEMVTGADGYYLYRSTKPTSGWSRIHEFKYQTADYYVDKDVEYTKQYYYTIRAYVKINNTIYKSDYVKPGVPGKSVAMTPEVSVKVKSYNSATIQWNAWYDADGYIVYRTTNSNNTGWEVIKTMKATDTVGSYTDKNLKCGTTYYYTVRSYEIVDGKKMKSGYEKYGKSCTPIPSTPQVKAVQQKNKTVVISWNKIAGATTYKV
ncbi:MAG: leucine-rich repeat protein, partial [Acutalibacteraceae bacterium]